MPVVMSQQMWPTTKKPRVPKTRERRPSPLKCRATTPSRCHACHVASKRSGPATSCRCHDFWNNAIGGVFGYLVHDPVSSIIYGCIAQSNLVMSGSTDAELQQESTSLKVSSCGPTSLPN